MLFSNFVVRGVLVFERSVFRHLSFSFPIWVDRNQQSRHSETGLNRIGKTTRNLVLLFYENKTVVIRNYKDCIRSAQLNPPRIWITSRVRYTSISKYSKKNGYHIILVSVCLLQQNMVQYVLKDMRTGDRLCSRSYPLCIRNFFRFSFELILGFVLSNQFTSSSWSRFRLLHELLEVWLDFYDCG